MLEILVELLPILPFKMCNMNDGDEWLVKCFTLGICLRPVRGGSAMLKSTVKQIIGETGRIKWSSIVTLDDF